jgi:hypothetical protein
LSDLTMTRQNVLACTSALLPMISIVDPITDASAHTNCLTKLLKNEPEPPKARGRGEIIRLPTGRSRCWGIFIGGARGPKSTTPKKADPGLPPCRRDPSGRAPWTQY